MCGSTVAGWQNSIFKPPDQSPVNLAYENCYSMNFSFHKNSKNVELLLAHMIFTIFSFYIFFTLIYSFTCDNYTIFFFLLGAKKSRQIVSAQYAFTFYTELTDSLSIVVSDVQVFRSRGSRARRYRRHAAAAWGGPKPVSKF